MSWTAENELYSHLSKLVEPEEAKTMIEEYKNEVIEEYRKSIKDKILSLPPDVVTEIKCDDNIYRNRPLIDFAKIAELINTENNEGVI